MLAAGFGLHAAFLFFSVSFRRLGYPFELEWMEGGMLAHVQRLLEGKALYPEPSPEFVPFIYGPLYSYAGALAACVTGPNLFSLRLVSFLSTLVLLAFLYRIVAYETGSRLFGLVAPCLFVATFDKSGGWFDLARVDSFALAWLAGAVDVTRRARLDRHFVAAGALLAGAALAKQTCVVLFPTLAWWAFASGRWRALAAFAGTSVALGFAWSLYELVRSDGWFLYYAVELPLLHGTKNREHLVTEFWRSEIAGVLPVATGVALLSSALLPRLPRPGAFAFHGAVSASLLLGSYASRLHMGSYLNDLMPAYAALSVVTALGLFALGAGCEARSRSTWQAAVALSLLAQLALLTYDRREHLPKTGSRRAGFELVERLRREPRDVLVVDHPQLAVLAGKSSYAHQMANVDIFAASGDPRGVREGLRERWRALFAAHHFSKVVIDNDFYVFRPELEAHYRRVEDLPIRPGVLLAVTGAEIGPRQVYVPR
ncbi:MAG TPA: glycosyltransferase family 39 protein [Polyangiaceae bacterium]